VARKFNDSIDLAGNQAIQMILENLSADPGSLLGDGRIWYDTVLDAVRVRANGATVSLATSAGAYTDENAQDAIATAFTNGTQSGVTVTYNDASNSLSIAVTNDETFQDAVGAFLEPDTGNVGITATYDDANNRMNFAVQYAAPSVTLGTAAAAGSANTAIRTDATILAFDATSPSTQAFNDSAVVGVATVAARRDHKHAMPAHTTALHQEMLATADLTDWPRTAALDLNSQQITGLAAGSLTTDAVNLGQLNAAIEGRQWKDPVATATTGALPNTPTYNAGAGTLTSSTNAALAAQASHTLVAGERLLVKDQASTFQNGIYTVTAVGSGAAPWVLTRVADANSATELSNATVLVEANDSSLRGKIYTQQNTLADLTAAAQNWTVTGDNNVYTADGTTLTLSGGQFSITNGGVGATQLATAVAGNGLAGGGGTALSVNVDATNLAITSDIVHISTGAAGAGLSGGGPTTALAVGAGTGITVNADDVAVNHTVVPMLYAANVTGGATSEVITHNLGTRDVMVTVYLAAGTFAEEEFSVEHTSTNTVTIRSATTIPATTYRVVVHG